MQFKRRTKEAGFSLIEALLAATIAAMIAIPVAVLLSQTTTAAFSKHQELDRLEFAHSLLEEMGVTYDFRPRNGAYRGRFVFAISSESVTPKVPSSFDAVLQLTRVTVTVEDQLIASRSNTVSQIFARDVE